VAPWTELPDSEPPRVNFSYPAEGEKGLALTSRIGLTLTELIDGKSAWRQNAVLLYPTDAGSAAAIAIDVSVQDTVLNVSPIEALEPNTSYTLEVVAGGVEDVSGNAIAEPFSLTFATGG
jgi:hypothetical protein